LLLVTRDLNFVVASNGAPGGSRSMPGVDVVGAGRRRFLTPSGSSMPG
jgi:hypothetical protein